MTNRILSLLLPADAGFDLKYSSGTDPWSSIWNFLRPGRSHRSLDTGAIRGMWWAEATIRVAGQKATHWIDGPGVRLPWNELGTPEGPADRCRSGGFMTGIAMFAEDASARVARNAYPVLRLLNFFSY
jgi:hypothetical protein